MDEIKNGKTKELRWRVIYGYGSSNYISIDESYLEKAKYAMITGKVFNYKSKTIRGREIKSIEPDFRFYTGWFDSYEYGSGDDQLQIDRDVPTEEIENRVLVADKRVAFVISKNQPELLQKPELLKIQ